MTHAEATSHAREMRAFSIPDKVGLESLIRVVERNRMLAANLKLIPFAAYKQSRGLVREGHPVHDDLMGEVSLRFVKTGDSFDPSRGIRFSTFAVKSMRFEAGRAMAVDLKRGLTGETNGKGISVALISELAAEKGESVSHGRFAAWFESLRATTADDSEAETFDAEDFIHGLIEQVGDPRTREILIQRFVEGLDLRTIAVNIGRSRERVRQICDTQIEAWRRCAEMGLISNPLEKAS